MRDGLPLRLGQQLLEQLERQRRVLAAPGGAACGRAARSSSYGGRPSPGDFIAMSASVSVWPAGRSRAATSFLAILMIGSVSLGYIVFVAVAERDARAA